MPVKNITIAKTFLHFTFALYQGIGAWHALRAVTTLLSDLHFDDQTIKDALSGHAPQLRLLIPGTDYSLYEALSLEHVVLQ